MEKFLYNRTIIAFGDSLTSGMYTADGIADRNGNHPYILEFMHRLRSMTTAVKEVGKPGATAEDLLYTLAPILIMENISDPLFVFILAGTNDLGHGRVPMTILWHLERMHNTVQQHALSIKRNIYSMVITIPPRWSDGDQSQRLLLNDGLRKYAARCHVSVALLDMEPVFNVSRKDTAYLWSRDSLHLSKAGYDQMGGMVYDKMVEFLSAKSESSLHGVDFDDQC